eukprot:scaffold517_cov255-Pinguiococcus_pyrenoidosus.AAC.1
MLDVLRLSDLSGPQKQRAWCQRRPHRKSYSQGRGEASAAFETSERRAASREPSQVTATQEGSQPFADHAVDHAVLPGDLRFHLVQIGRDLAELRLLHHQLFRLLLRRRQLQDRVQRVGGNEVLGGRDPVNRPLMASWHPFFPQSLGFGFFPTQSLRAWRPKPRDNDGNALPSYLPADLRASRAAQVLLLRQSGAEALLAVILPQKGFGIRLGGVWRRPKRRLLILGAGASESVPQGFESALGHEPAVFYCRHTIWT